MKTLLKILFFSLLVTQIGFTQWYQQTSGTTQNLNAVTFLDTNNGLAIGDSGIIVRTSNGGTSWSFVTTDVTNNLTAMCFTDDNNGWIVGGGPYPVGDSSVILHTTNGGLNWIKQKTVASSTLADIYFVDQQIGFAVGHVTPGSWEYSILLKTLDGGVTWTQFNYDSLNVPQRVHFFDANNGWMMRGVCGSGGCGGDINKTTDGGTSWISKRSGYFNDIQFTDSNNGIAVTTARFLEEEWGVLTKTTDGGESWSSDSVYSPAYDVFYVNSNTVVTLGHHYGDSVICYWSTDAGSTWNPRPTGIYEDMYHIFFIDEQNGWMIGNNGAIFHTTNGGVSFVEEEEIDDVPTEFLLSNNYPNPFNPSTKIKYSVPQSSNVTIKVFDILGNEIETLINKEKPAGTYEVTWYAEQLPSGVYLYQLKAGAFVETKKMLLLK